MSLLLLFSGGPSGVAVTYDALIAAEYLASPLFDGLASAEWVAPILTVDGRPGAEFLLSVQGSNATAAEAGTGLRFDAALTGEFLLSLLRDAPDTAEVLRSSSSDAYAGIESAANLLCDALAGAEFSRVFRFDGVAGAEVLLFIPQNAPAGAEGGITIQSNATASVEWSGIILFVADGLAALESGVSIRFDGLPAAEVGRLLNSDSLVATEALTRLLRDANTTAEWGTRPIFVVDGLASMEVGTGVLYDSDAALEYRVFLKFVYAPFVRALRRLNYVAALAPSDYTALAPKTSYVALARPGDMPQILPPLPDVATAQVQTMAVDFGFFLVTGVTLMGTPILNLGVSAGSDPDPQSRLNTEPAIGTSPTSQGGSGIVNAAVLFQVADCQSGVTYTVEAICARSDGDTAEAWTRFTVVDPN